jgi:septal ring factor EnvC (AmiA/AmiB activator)
MAAASDGLMKLRPVTYRYKKAYADGSKPVDYGLIAEEVAEVYPDLVVKNADGQIQTVQYQKLTPMLLNEVQKEHKQLEEQAEKIQRQEKSVEEQQETIKQLQKRLAALEAAQPSSASELRSTTK